VAVSHEKKSGRDRRARELALFDSKSEIESVWIFFLKKIKNSEKVFF
jgi:hypothetical protein